MSLVLLATPKVWVGPDIPPRDRRVFVIVITSGLEGVGIGGMGPAKVWWADFGLGRFGVGGSGRGGGGG